MIYKVTEEMRAAMEGMLEAVEVESTLGQVEVKQTFKASRVGMIAGCEVTRGPRHPANAEVRLVRDGTVVWTGKIGSLRRFSDDVREVEAGQECGIVLEGYADSRSATCSRSSRPSRSSKSSTPSRGYSRKSCPVIACGA